MKNLFISFFAFNVWASAYGASTPADSVPQTSRPAFNTIQGVAAADTSLDPKPATGATSLPESADTLLGGYGKQAQQSLILAYFAAGTLGDALVAGSVPKDDGKHQAESYLNLATSARDDLRTQRATYALDAQELALLDKLAAAYADVIPMIEADSKLADAPNDPAARAAFQTARRKAFATLSALFGWK